MNVENPRLRLVLGNQWRVLLVVLGVVALASFAAAATTYQDRPTDTRSIEVNQQTVATNASHQATVVRKGFLWPKGTVLENKPVYSLNATPTVRTTARTNVSGADAARIRHVWRLRISVVTGERTYYTETRTLANATHRGTTARTTATIDIREVMQRVSVVGQKARSLGTVEVDLLLRVVYRTNPGSDGGYAGTERYSAPLQLRGETYAIGGDIGGKASHSTTRQQTVAQPRDWGSIGAMALVGVVALALAGAVVSTDPREIDVEQARIDLHRTQYEEWISPGTIPMSISQQFVELDTIEDVVDVAIDTNERVVWDRRRDLYAVISENVVYYFSTGGSWMESAFRPMRRSGGGSPPGDGDGPGPFDGAPGSAPVGAPDDPFDEDVEAGAFGFPDESESPFGEGDEEGEPFDEASGSGPFGDEDSPDESSTDGPFGDADGDPFGDADGDPLDGSENGDPFGDAAPFDGEDTDDDADSEDDPA